MVWSLKQHLKENGLGINRWDVSDIAVDSNGSYKRSPHAEELEPMMSMPIGGFYPDLVCTYERAQEGGLAAFEVKSRFEEWVKGITQARAYQDGVHRSYLALPEDNGSRFSVLERDAQSCGVGVWLLRKKGWEEIISAAIPRPNTATTVMLRRALRGISAPGKLKLNHPLNYLAVAWLCGQKTGSELNDAMEAGWADLRTDGSRALAIRGARYLGMVDQNDNLTVLGQNVFDLMQALEFSPAQVWDKQTRFCDAYPGLSAVSRLVLMQQESTKLLVEALSGASGDGLNTEELLRTAEMINSPLATGLLLLNPRDAKLPRIPSHAFSPSNVFVLKQVLWHAGILSTPKHPTAGKSAQDYQHEQDYWKLEERIQRAGSQTFG